MKYFFLLSPLFLEWPLAICRELANRDPDMSARGLVTGSQKIIRQFESAEPKFARLDDQDKLERAWLAAAYDPARLRRHEDRLGSAVINRLLIADRQVGAGFVSGASLVRTPLTKFALKFNREVPRKYLAGLLDYVTNVFEEDRPDVVFCYVVTSAPQLAFAELSKHFGVPFVCLTPGRVGARMVLDTSPLGLLEPVAELYYAASKSLAEVEAFLPAAKTMLEEYRNRPRPPEYFVRGRSEVLRRHSAIGIAKRLPRLAATGLYFDRQPIRTSRFRAELTEVACGVRARRTILDPLFDRFESIRDPRYVYFPLQVSPEASTMVLSPMHTDQTAAVEALAKSLPTDTTLVVKEHIPMIGRRPRGFYQRLKQMPGVMLVSPFEDNFTLIRNSSLVAVITGTAAFEAMMLRVPALVLGNSPYLAMGEGIRLCADYSELPRVVPDCMDMKPATDETLERYLAALLKRSFDFPAGIYWSKVSRQTVEANISIAVTIAAGLHERAVRAVAASY